MENKSGQINPNTNTQVLSMDAAGNIVESTSGADITAADNFNDFFNTGRIGRRNALPDILSIACATTSTADLPEKFNALTTTDVMSSNIQPSDSGAIVPSSSTSLSTTSNITCSSSSSNYNDSNINPT
ncbi:cAMP-dependent protein kinase inhibitor beta-like isoform X2 [Condylostylus longicornis]|nr:cAMP-dependent protein kinase inhibitor beta-like isoform X2 [Condylostylus longicornis]